MLWHFRSLELPFSGTFAPIVLSILYPALHSEWTGLYEALCELTAANIHHIYQLQLFKLVV